MTASVRAWLGSTHPGPSVTVTLVTVGLALGVGLAQWQVVLLGLAMLLGQFSVGLSNDWIDAGRDAATGRDDKPVARRQISISVVRASAWITAALALALTVPLGAWALLAHGLFMLGGWAYNAWLKSTVLSVLPYLWSFGLLPAVVTACLPAPAAWWALVTGALLGIAAHVANALPDLEADRATGVRGFPHRLGPRASGMVLAAALAAASALLFAGVPDGLHAVGLALGVALALVCVVLVWRERLSRLLFRLIMLAALLDVALLVLSGAAIVAASA